MHYYVNRSKLRLAYIIICARSAHTAVRDRIEVHNTEKVDGVNVQKLTIHYNCVGTLEIPDREHLEKPSIIMQTRKGVAVSYAPSQKEHEKAGCSHNTQML